MNSNISECSGMLSIIIPTYNEERCLSVLLKSIKSRDYNDYEIIVADANSTDKTKAIAKEYGCKVVKGGLPARGRNAGAKHAKGEILLFVDADVVMPQGFLRDNLADFKSRDLVCAGVWAKANSKRPDDKFIYFLGSILQYWVRNIKPIGIGWCIFITKKVFDKIGGFDEKLLVGEDIDLTTRSKACGRFDILKKKKIYVSVRRLEKEGRLNYLLKRAKTSFYDFTGKKMTVKNREVEYEFGGYDKKKPRKKARRKSKNKRAWFFW
jgi:glycosyltransferase involved in cell wall biosynthesis